MKIQTGIAASVLMGALVFSQGEAYQGPNGAKKQPQGGKQCAAKQGAQKCDPKGAQMWQQMLQKFDTNQNGQIEGDEKTAAHQWKEQQCAAMKAQQAKQCSQKQAGGGDGMWQTVLQKFDWDSDGQLNESEKTAAHLWKQQQCGKK